MSKHRPYHADRPTGEPRVTPESPQELAARLHLQFDDVRLLVRALTHRSFINEHPHSAIEDNERLEFLGDAVLDFMVADWLYNTYPEMKEGDLTRMRSSLVYTDQLAEYANQINLSQSIRLGRGERESRENMRLPILCDAFEALVGAIYIDQGFETVRNFMLPLLEKTAASIDEEQPIDDPKGSFQIWAQSNGLGTPRYITKDASGPEHMRRFEVDVLANEIVFGTGYGPSKQVAEKAAALNALEQGKNWINQKSDLGTEE